MSHKFFSRRKNIIHNFFQTLLIVFKCCLHRWKLCDKIRKYYYTSFACERRVSDKQCRCQSELHPRAAEISDRTHAPLYSGEARNSCPEPYSFSSLFTPATNSRCFIAFQQLLYKRKGGLIDFRLPHPFLHRATTSRRGKKRGSIYGTPKRARREDHPNATQEMVPGMKPIFDGVYINQILLQAQVPRHCCQRAFSRPHRVPFPRGREPSEWLFKLEFKKGINIY